MLNGPTVASMSEPKPSAPSHKPTNLDPPRLVDQEPGPVWPSRPQQAHAIWIKVAYLSTSLVTYKKQYKLQDWQNNNLTLNYQNFELKHNFQARVQGAEVELVLPKTHACWTKYKRELKNKKTKAAETYKCTYVYNTTKYI